MLFLTLGRWLPGERRLHQQCGHFAPCWPRAFCIAFACLPRFDPLCGSMRDREGWSPRSGSSFPALHSRMLRPWLTFWLYLSDPRYLCDIKQVTIPLWALGASWDTDRLCWVVPWKLPHFATYLLSPWASYLTSLCLCFPPEHGGDDMVAPGSQGCHENHEK